MRAYYIHSVNDDVVPLIGRLLKAYVPDHRPILTGIGVAGLALKGMRIEIEVTAHLG